MRLKAMAKINLGLDVLGKREDGYHEVRMIMQTIRMYDILDIRKTKRPGIVLTTNLPFIPTDSRNLVYKAAQMLMDEFGIEEGLSIKLRKFIPVAAGMAGGSSDAAAAFVGVNRMFHLGLTEEQLMERAVKVGADVPYCIMRGTALAEGIGEKLKRLPKVPECYVLVGKPGINVSTKTAYENLNLAGIGKHPDIDGLIRDIECGDLYAMASKMENVFEPGIIRQYPVIGNIKELMEEKGALKAMMSGSGPTVFLITEIRWRRQPEVSERADWQKQYLPRIFTTGMEELQMTSDFSVDMNEYLPLRDVVFNTLRQAILKGELKPGERLLEIALAERLGVSRTPVREAMRKLEQEGLVVMIPRRGAQVASITEKDLNDVLEVRIALENVAIEKACKLITEEELGRLWVAAKEFEKTKAEGNLVRLAEADVAFHEIIYQASDNKRLNQVLNNLREQMYRYRVEYLKEEQTRNLLVSEHEELVKAIREGDVQKAQDISFHHLENQRMAIIRTIRAENAARESEKKE